MTNENPKISRIIAITSVSFIIAAVLAGLGEFFELPVALASLFDIDPIWFHVILSVFFVLLVGSIATVIISRVLKSRSKLEMEFTTQEKRLTSFPEYNPNPVFEVSLKGEIIYLNPSAKEFFPGIEWKDSNHSAIAGLSTMVERFLKGTLTVEKREVCVGNKIYLQTIKYVKETASIHIYCVDITELKRMQEHTSRINQVLQALRDINQLITREKNSQLILDGLCSVLIQLPGFSHSWITQPDDKNKLVLSSESGIGENFESMHKQLTDGIIPNCVSEAYRLKKQTVISPDIEYCKGCVLQKEPGKFECVATPILFRGQPLGILSATVNEDPNIDEEELDLILEMASDVATALSGVEIKGT